MSDLLENMHSSLQNIPGLNFHDTLLTLPNNLQLPSRIMTKMDTTLDELLLSMRSGCIAPGVLITHGLGARNPSSKDVSSDDWIPIIALGVFSGTQIPSVISYTTRGHGKSSGWQASAENDPNQFTWLRLSNDMKSVSDYFNYNQIIVGGSSMGSATSLYAALQYPDLVKGVIMIRPPTAWETRQIRRKALLNSADNCKARHPTELHHFVLRGTAYSDLPPLDAIETYKQIRCPVLILAVSGDESHPLSTAESLASRLPNARMCVVDSLEQAYAEWPQIVAEFVNSLL